MKKERIQIRKRDFPPWLQDKLNHLNSRNKNEEIKIRTAQKTPDSKCNLYNLNPSEVPRKVLSLTADIPDLLKVKPNEHYQGKIYDQPINPEIENNTKMYEDRWTNEEIGDFDKTCEKLVKIKGNVIIQTLKEKFPYKTVKELVQHHYISYQPIKKKGRET